MNLLNRVEHRPFIFFGLDAASNLAVLGGRRLFHLPYQHAEMRIVKKDGWIHRAPAG